MKLSISNIAWQADKSEEMLLELSNIGVGGIEVAPTAHWGRWAEINKSLVAKYKRQLEACSLQVPALQSIFYGTKFTSIFDFEQHQGLLGQVSLVAEIASWLDAGVIVFGAPKLRQKNGLSEEAATLIAEELFQKMGEICSNFNCVVGIENNPSQYGCDFLCTVAEVDAFVSRLGHPNVAVHVDSAGIFMSGESGEVISDVRDVCHYHISEPYLDPIIDGKVDHAEMFTILSRSGYEGWVSIEMKAPSAVRDVYSSVSSIRAILASGEQ